jgi:hypothetical protein
MMTDDRDPLLQTLFAEAQQDLDGEIFIDRVMAQTRTMRYKAIAGFICVTLILATCAWLLAIPQELAELFAQVLTRSLIDLGDSWLAWMLAPVNNIGSLLVLSAKVLRMAWKKVVYTSYAR